ncbi:unnamed protein product, partial [Phaeothamnion confervicola]
MRRGAVTATVQEGTTQPPASTQHSSSCILLHREEGAGGGASALQQRRRRVRTAKIASALQGLPVPRAAASFGAGERRATLPSLSLSSFWSGRRGATVHMFYNHFRSQVATRQPSAGAPAEKAAAQTVAAVVAAGTASADLKPLRRRQAARQRATRLRRPPLRRRDARRTALPRNRDEVGTNSVSIFCAGGDPRGTVW